MEDVSLFEGDILLSREQKEALSIDTSTPTRQTRAVVKLERKKWPNGIVPYVFSSQFSKYAAVNFYKYIDNNGKPVLKKEISTVSFLLCSWAITE